MAKTIDLRRHFKNDGDVLSAEGVQAAVRAGKGLTGRYRLAVSSGAQRATQAVACLLAGHGKPVAGGVIVDPGLRSAHEPRWIELIGGQGRAHRVRRREVLRHAPRSMTAGLMTRLRAGREQIVRVVWIGTFVRVE